MVDARSQVGQDIEFVPCDDPPYDAVCFVAERHEPGAPTLLRILLLAQRLGAKTISIEHLDPSQCTDLAEENEDVQHLCPGFDPTTDSSALRLGFFTKPLDAKEQLPDVAPEELVGYVIVKEDNVPPTEEICPRGDSETRVYEAVLRTPVSNRSYMRRAPTWKCIIGGCPFDVTGCLYAQQGGITSTCAHVALRSAATWLIGKDLSYRQINKWVQEFHGFKDLKELRPWTGLTTDAMEHVLRKSGGRTFSGKYPGDEMATAPYQRYVYGAVESGFPAILAFATGLLDTADEPECHAIPLFGHTFDENTWAPGAQALYFPIHKVTQCLSSASWVGMFLAHDDNVGPNYHVPRFYLDAKRFCPRKPKRSILRLLKRKKAIPCERRIGVVYVVGTCHPGAEIDPLEAEAIAANCLRALLVDVPTDKPEWQTYEWWHWWKRLTDHDKYGQIVLRPLFVTGADYRAHLRSLRDRTTQAQIPNSVLDWMSLADDALFWLVEVSLPSLFSGRRRKLGELLIHADRSANTNAAMNLCYARMPGCILRRDDAKTAAAGMPIFRSESTGIDDHVGLLTC